MPADKITQSLNKSFNTTLNNTKNFYKKNQRIIIIFLVIFVVLPLAVYVLKKLTNTESFSNNSNKMYFFNVDWCGHCKKAKPEWTEFVNKLEKNNNAINGANVEAVSVNGDNEKELTNEYDIKGYPTFILKKSNGESVNYGGARTSNGLYSFLEQNL